MVRRIDRTRRELPPDVVTPRELVLAISEQMREFLEREAIRLSRKKRKYTVQDIIRAVLAAYYEKRAMGLLIDPDG
jgi:hypothetical protein